MKQTLLFFVILSSILFPQLKELEVKTTENRGGIPIFRDHPDKAGIIFYTQFDNLSFYSSYGIVQVKGDPTGGKYVVIIEPVKQTIEVRAPGFKTEMIRLETMQPRDVIYYEVLPKKDDGIVGITEIAVTIQVTPQDASILVDGTSVINDTPTKLAIGTHRLRVEKSGYTPSDREITIDPNSTFFRVNLSTNDPVPVTINSTPSDAEILVDGMSKGKTRKALFMYPGSYEIRLSLSGYLPITEKITVSQDEKQNNFTFNLVKNTGKLKIEVSPTIATVSINKEVVNAFEIQELTPGTYQIEAEAETWYPYKGSFEIVLGQTKTERINLKQKAGKLQFAINPPEAECVLSQNGIEKYRWTGLKLFNSIAEGGYDLYAKAKGHKKYFGVLTIRDGETTNLDIQMIEGSDIPEWMVYVEGGKYLMGCTNEQENCQNDEEPVHEEEVMSFLVGKTEVTRLQFSEFVKQTGYITQAEKDGYGDFTWADGSLSRKYSINWRSFYGDSKPVRCVSLLDAIAYCNWLSEIEGLNKVYSETKEGVSCDYQKNGYRLPTEVEWEFAARGGKRSQGFVYSGSNTLDRVGWYGGMWSDYGNRTRDDETAEVAKLKPNELGLFDMSGNVNEMCFDEYKKYDGEFIPFSIYSDPIWVCRGGSWMNRASDCRVSSRGKMNPARGNDRLGFRVVRTYQ